MISREEIKIIRAKYLNDRSDVEFAIDSILEKTISNMRYFSKRLSEAVGKEDQKSIEMYELALNGLGKEKRTWLLYRSFLKCNDANLFRKHFTTIE